MALASRRSYALTGPSRNLLSDLVRSVPLESLGNSSSGTTHFRLAFTGRPAFSSASARDGRGLRPLDRGALAAQSLGAAQARQFRRTVSRCLDSGSLLRCPSVQSLQGGHRCFSTHFLAELPPRVLLYLAKEVQGDAVVSVQEGLEVPRLLGAVRRAQRAAGGGETGHETRPTSAPGRAHIPLEELWGQLIFLLHGRLHQLDSEDLCLLLEVLAAAGPLALRHSHRSLSRSRPAGPQREEAAAVTTSTGLQDGHVPAYRVREGGLTGSSQWRPDILDKIEALLVPQVPNVPLRAAVAAVNSPQLLLYPFLQLPQRFLSPPHTTTTAAGTKRSLIFLELLQPLMGPLEVIALDSPPNTKASAYRQLDTAVGKGPRASVAAGLVEVWHAALSLDLHPPSLSAVTLKEADKGLPLLPLSCDHYAIPALLVENIGGGKAPLERQDDGLAICCMHLTASSITYEHVPAVQLPPPHEGGFSESNSDSPTGTGTTKGEEGAADTSMRVSSSVLLRAADHLAHNALQLQPHQALLALEGFAHIGFCPGEAVDKLLEMSLLRRVSQMRIEELIATLRLLQSLGIHDAELLQSVTRQLAEPSKDCPLFLLGEALEQLHLLGSRSPVLCKQIAARPPEEHLSLDTRQSARLRHSLEKEGITLASLK